ncbi:hypothetical protein MMAG44476_39220 [Mycolicibacterium mageritense DSM 44476 = CIP 104973]|jgi:hypothetical protein|uniref:GF22716 n=2 Tax=Mycolicibacterium TaxID=1866885 RepID=A0A117IA33_MYCCR|nr:MULTISPECIES: hypothetical protein [Mycolicibacterium]MCC9184588.1 hypothetical protein [Mycolicibacterium mageritense]MCV7212706.1 hypothetical protein [Mycolicibacterium canariasense]ORV09788.1 hypothetical protein AWB94_08805 [Mycolicibacterium canariasense]CDO25805.1 hypothetical protein BN978_06351 [Mycolicibacterium mageritense DSM 44476 = CIP 104973]BBX37529.1 hypothetical protein MMAGJ_68110 [Mycolicibacterium mageritense]
MGLDVNATSVGDRIRDDRGKVLTVHEIRPADTRDDPSAGPIVCAEFDHGHGVCIDAATAHRYEPA